MKYLAYLGIVLFSCSSPSQKIGIQNTWLLIHGEIIKGSDTTFTDYTKGQKVIKIINETHFSFLRHDLSKGLDSLNQVFVAGAGSYSLKGNIYKEHLEFCSYRPWEGNEFEFTIEIKGDTLIQTGIEKIDELNVDQVITETYLKVH